MNIFAEKISFAYPDSPEIFTTTTVTFAEGKLNVLLGANGCGKSTLLKLLCGIVSPVGGRVVLDGKTLQKYSPLERARRIAFMGQQPAAPYDLTVSELVMLGRYPHRTSAETDRQIVLQAMSDAGVSHLAQRKVAALSGGEKTGAFFALALAQQSRILLLDEPSAALDPGNAYTFFKTLRRLTAEQGLTVIASLHHIDEALRYGDNMIGLRGGKVLFAAPPETAKPQILQLYDGFDADFKWGL